MKSIVILAISTLLLACGVRSDLSNDTLTISGKGAMPDYSLKEAPWHKDREAIKTVVIETGVTSIGSHAFYEYKNLTSVSIPNSVTSIGHDAFWNCENLTSVTIPNSVQNIGVYAFLGCTSLTSIDVESGNNNFVSENGVLFNKSKDAIIQYPQGKTDKCYVIPDGVTWIGVHAFSSCDTLTSITIPNSVTWIGLGAFWNCGLTSITIPSSVTTIENWAFGRCDKLTSITNLNPVPVDVHPSVFTNVNQSECTLKVPIASVSAYKNADVWKDFNIVGIEE